MTAVTPIIDDSPKLLDLDDLLRLQNAEQLGAGRSIYKSEHRSAAIPRGGRCLYHDQLMEFDVFVPEDSFRWHHGDLPESHDRLIPLFTGMWHEQSKEDDGRSLAQNAGA